MLGTPQTQAATSSAPTSLFGTSATPANTSLFSTGAANVAASAPSLFGGVFGSSTPAAGELF